VEAERKLSELRKEERVALLALLSGYQIPVTGHQGYAKAEVTGGGIPLREINCATMESKVGMVHSIL
jgi:predicted flavoprotein YhiN